MKEIKNPVGRPVKPESERLEQRSIRLTPPQWAKVERMGVAALRQLIERWKAR